MARFGICAAPQQAPAIAAAGYDFIECPVPAVFGQTGEEGIFEESWRIIREAGLVAEAFNCFISPEVKITGPDIDFEELIRQATRTLEKAHQMGGSVMVFGSGEARMIPEGFSCQRGREQIHHFLKTIGNEALRIGIIVAIEPLCREACNVLNTVRQAAEVCRNLDQKNIRVLADYFHMGTDGEPLDNLKVAPDLLAHVHIADPQERVAPGQGPTDITPFFRALKGIGYDGRISLECRWKDFGREIREVLLKIKDQWQNA